MSSICSWTWRKKLNSGSVSDFQSCLIWSTFLGYERTGPGEEDWITADGSEDFYTNWKNNEPDNEDDNEYCAEIDVEDDGEMSDVPCEYNKDQRGKGEGESKRHYTCRKEVGPGEFFFINIKDDKKGPKGKNKEQICECTENGAECEELSECPQFIRMEGEVTYANASAICAEHNGYVTFFEDEDEFEEFMEEDVKRKEWLGKKHRDTKKNELINVF